MRNRKREFDGRVYVIVTRRLAHQRASFGCASKICSTGRFIERHLGANDMAGRSGHERPEGCRPGVHQQSAVAPGWPRLTSSWAASCGRATLELAGPTRAASGGTTPRRATRSTTRSTSERGFQARNTIRAASEDCGIHGRNPRPAQGGRPLQRGIDYDIYDIFNYASATISSRRRGTRSPVRRAATSASTPSIRAA